MGHPDASQLRHRFGEFLSNRTTHAHNIKTGRTCRLDQGNLRLLQTKPKADFRRVWCVDLAAYVVCVLS